MKNLLADYIFSDSLRYEGHKLIYTYSPTEEPIQIGGFLAAALLCVRLVNTDEGERREITLDLEQNHDNLFKRYDAEVIADDWGYLVAEINQLNDAYIQLAVSKVLLPDLCPNTRQLSIAMNFLTEYMQGLAKEEFNEHIWEAEPWKMPFAHWLFDAGYKETQRQKFLNIDWIDPVIVNNIAEEIINNRSQITNNLSPTFFFNNEDSKDLLRRYWDWLWNYAKKDAAVFPDANLVMAENKLEILAHETNYDDLKPEMKNFTPDQINLFRQWMKNWKEFVEQQIKPVSIQKKDIRQELFLDNVMPIPPEHNYVKVREYILERCKYDKEFKNFVKLHKRTELCDQLTILFDWPVDSNALGKRMRSKAKK